MRIVTLSQLSLAGSSGIAEAKIPLWWADGTSAGQGSSATSGAYLLSDGGGFSASPATSKNQIFTLSSGWSGTTKFAFEVSGDISGATTANFALWDITSNAIVSGSQVSTTSTTMTVIRSAQFTLIPSHVYGVTAWPNSTTYTASLSDASLIIFP